MLSILSNFDQTFDKSFKKIQKHFERFENAPKFSFTKDIYDFEDLNKEFLEEFNKDYLEEFPKKSFLENKCETELSDNEHISTEQTENIQAKKSIQKPFKKHITKNKIKDLINNNKIQKQFQNNQNEDKTQLSKLNNGLDKQLKALRKNKFDFIEKDYNDEKEWIFGKKSKNLKNEGKIKEKYFKIKSKDNYPKENFTCYSKNYSDKNGNNSQYVSKFYSFVQN